MEPRRVNDGGKCRGNPRGKCPRPAWRARGLEHLEHCPEGKKRSLFKGAISLVPDAEKERPRVYRRSTNVGQRGGCIGGLGRAGWPRDVGISPRRHPSESWDRFRPGWSSMNWN